MAKLVTVKELEQILKVSRDTIYRWRKEKGLPFKIIGNGSVRFDLEAVNAWIDKQEEIN